MVSALLRRVPTRFRASTSAAVGALAMVAACGRGAIHPATALGLALINQALAGSSRRAMAALLAFAHLGVVRAIGAAEGLTNAALLVLVLRLAAAGDAQHGPRGAGELIRYACCYHGLFTAPFYTYDEWQAAMRAPCKPPTAHALGRAVLAVLCSVFIWLATAKYLPFDDALNAGAWSSWGFWARPLYFYVSSYQYRFRFYACWLVMEVSGLLLGLASPSNGEA